jgi:hypothetical protein
MLLAAVFDDYTIPDYGLRNLDVGQRKVLFFIPG